MELSQVHGLLKNFVPCNSSSDQKTPQKTTPNNPKTPLYIYGASMDLENSI